jgi:hypothetical protein
MAIDWIPRGGALLSVCYARPQPDGMRDHGV